MGWPLLLLPLLQVVQVVRRQMPIMQGKLLFETSSWREVTGFPVMAGCPSRTWMV